MRMTARARVWVGDWAPARCQPMDPTDTDHCHLSRRGRVPDEKTPGHEATISPPSRTCTLKIEGVEDPRASEPMHVHEKVHGHASPIKMYATHMCNGCTTYKMQLERCIRHSCTPTVIL
ncbi:hypothetical protein EVAR_51707_1 [Eumeta japonica]|uniref:Uncharacterized protein n=1 Tax=Eumeta variegata TaxID=151549 RepID=A0A4C1XKL2_EUMVA|nr:hypothetical protein EVAR_51707_1 [Eumeta japonica]